ncbi:hypothetical protein [Pandoraea pulmonicola]|uniref:Peptidase C39-like domain-containing protein n=2 Tax=Pandoraea pulmonicola TaxID=93221 RepID=A0AAJ4ZH68_PANPU|nr:hypothetical protein [Pandoraea pulmonicola]SUA93234.1 Uncharacterised protein [Pandoraea pulmonicola]
MSQSDIDAIPTGDEHLPASLNIQNMPLVETKGQTSYSNDNGYFTGYDVGGDTLKLSNSYFENQQQSLWCWIAVASTLGNFYAGGTRYTQAYLYNNIQGTNCNPPYMQAPPYSQCNMSGNAEISMKRINIWQATEIASPGMPILLGELLNGRPFVVVLEMDVQRNFYLHCVVIDAAFVIYNQGYRSDYWNVCDPIEGANFVSVSSFPASYPGKWGASQWYLTMLSQAN